MLQALEIVLGDLLPCSPVANKIQQKRETLDRGDDYLFQRLCIVSVEPMLYALAAAAAKGYVGKFAMALLILARARSAA